MVTLEEYVLKEYRGRSFKALREVYEKVVRGELELVDPSPPRSLLEYLSRLDYSLWFWSTLALSAATVLLIYFSWAHPALTILRYIFGSLFVLYLPGYVVVEALYPSERELSPLERLALSIGLSLAVVPLLGLLLNYTPWGIRLTPVAFTLFIFILVVAVVAAYRKTVVARLESELFNRKNKINKH